MNVHLTQTVARPLRGVSRTGFCCIQFCKAPIVATIILSFLAGCARQGSGVVSGDANPTDNDSSLGATGARNTDKGAAKTFVSQTHGEAVSWPAGWEQHSSSEYELLLLPNNSRPDDQTCSITVDVPQLPFHIKNLIPIAAVRNGYLDDLRKQFGTLNIEDLPAPPIPDAKVDLVRSTWQSGGRQESEIALLVVHDDHVYLLRGRSDAQHDPQVRKAFEQIVSSFHWNTSASH